MFTAARLKLTAWYVIIIMLVSVIFSGIIYRESTYEIERSLIQQQYRFDRRFAPYVTNELLAEAEGRVRLALILINAGILTASAIAGYFLAGKTLNPIEKMVTEQKQFVANASHELRTPLTTLRTEIEVALRDKKISLATKRLLKSNLEEVTRMQALSDYLLSLSRYQQNTKQLALSATAIKPIIHKSVQQLTPIAKKRKIKLIEKTQNKYVMGNSDSLSELTKIIIDNAIKYSKNSGKVTVATITEGKNLKINVSDTGVGIKASDLPHIFDRFYRADQARAKLTSGGYGLGLAIAKQIVWLHHGSIAVSSKENKGTTVSVSLPLTSSS